MSISPPSTSPHIQREAEYLEAIAEAAKPKGYELLEDCDRLGFACLVNANHHRIYLSFEMCRTMMRVAIQVDFDGRQAFAYNIETFHLSDPNLIVLVAAHLKVKCG